MYTIYKITNKINGMVYIGQTRRSLVARWRAHCWRARNEESRQNALMRAIRTHGEENFEIEAIDACMDRNMADKREIYWISHYNSRIPNGYNHTRGGDNHGPELQDFREKVCGEKHWTSRKSVTEETRKRMSEAQYGAKSNNHRACKCVETGETFPYVKAVTRKYGFNASHIHAVCKGKRKRCGGYHWIYINDREVIHNKE